MTMPVPIDTLHTELEQIVAVLEAVKGRLEPGVPGDELPATNQNAEIFRFQLRGEIVLCAGRLATLAEVLDL